jgi:hypothetical protein
MLQFQFFPRSYPTAPKLLEITEVFKQHITGISSQTHQLSSNEVLLTIANGLEKIGFKVEKVNLPKIKSPFQSYSVITTKLLKVS